MLWGSNNKQTSREPRAIPHGEATSAHMAHRIPSASRPTPRPPIPSHPYTHRTRTVPTNPSQDPFETPCSCQARGTRVISGGGAEGEDDKENAGPAGGGKRGKGGAGGDGDGLEGDSAAGKQL